MKRLQSALPFVKVIAVPLVVMMVAAIYFNMTAMTLLWALLFWLLVFPFTVFVSVKKISGGNGYEAADTMLGVYLLMVFMIYDHYASDFFFLMIATMPYNMFVITLTNLSTKRLAVNGDFNTAIATPD